MRRITSKKQPAIIVFVESIQTSDERSNTALLVAWPSGSRRRFYDGHDRKVDGSTPTHASLLRPRTLSKMLYDNYHRVVESDKPQIEAVRSKIQAENSQTRRQLLSESGFVLCIASPSLSRDRRIKMK